MHNKFQMSLDDNISFAKRMIVDSIYREALVEGINVTFPETQQIYENGIVSGLKSEDIIKITNLKNAWAFLFETIDYPFDIRYLRALNGLIQNNLLTDPGSFRTVNVRISGTSLIPSIPVLESVEKDLAEIRGIENDTERAVYLMLAIMRGQYFLDGNKRTAQLAANQEMIRHGRGILSVPEEHRLEFSSLLVKFYETGIDTKLSEFIFDKCIDGYNSSQTGESGKYREDLNAVLSWCKENRT